MRRLGSYTIRVIGLVVLYVAIVSITGAMMPPVVVGNIQPDSVSKINDVAALIAIALIDTILLSLVVRRTTLGGIQLWAMVAVVVFGVKSLTSLFEAWFFMPNVDASLAVTLGTLWIPLVLVWPIGLVVAFGTTSAEILRTDDPPLTGGVLLRRVGLLSALVYPAFFFVFGYFIAWQNTELRDFYLATSDGSISPDSSLSDQILLYLFETIRGLFWVALAVPILWTTQGSWWQRGLLVALIFALVQNNVHFLSNPLMPGVIRWWHFWETSSSNFLWGMSIAWVLCRDMERRT